jgi:hypothetical protein
VARGLDSYLVDQEKIRQLRQLFSTRAALALRCDTTVAADPMTAVTAAQ